MLPLNWRKIAAWPTGLSGVKVLRAAGWLLLVLLISAGCAAGFHSSLLEAEGRVASQRLGLGDVQDRGSLPVVYPAGLSPAPAAGNPMTAEYGPAWRGLEPVYREYRFNPFVP